MVAAGGIAALVVAAIVTWNIFEHSGTASALGSSTPQGATVQVPGAPSDGSSGSSHSHPSAGARRASGTPSVGGTSSAHGSKPTSGHSGSGNPKSNPSGRPSIVPSTGPGSSSGPGSPSPSVSPTPSPSSTSPTSTGVTLPAGYRWHKFGATAMDALAGFKIGMPDAWTQALNVPLAQLNDGADGFHLNVNLSYWMYLTPLSEAQYLQSLAATAHKGHGYKELLLSTVNFSALGGYRSAGGAELKYSWNSASLGYNETELVVLVTLSTSAGSQPYEFDLTAPTSTWSTARGILTAALPTFRPLPG
jgi:hypothetical protein